MKKESKVYYGENIEDTKYLYLKEISFYLDITNYLLYNYEGFLTYEENLQLIKNIKIINKLSKIFKNTLDKEEIDTKKVDYIMYLFNKISKYTDTIQYKVLKNELTDIEKYKQGEDFNFLVHTITNHSNRLSSNLEITSASLINEENIAIFSNSKNDNNYGYILDFNLNNIVLFCDSDVFSDINIEERNEKLKSLYKCFIYDDFHVKVSPLTTNGISKIAKIIPINYLKKLNISECLDYNLEKLNYDNSETYNEVVLLNNDNLIKKAIFVRTVGDKSFSKDYKKALELSKETKLPLIEIDLSLYREKYDLDILTTSEKNMVIKKIKDIIYSDNDIYFSYCFSDQKEDIDKDCLKIYKDLRDEEYLNEEALKDYIIKKFSKAKIKQKTI